MSRPPSPRVRRETKCGLLAAFALAVTACGPAMVGSAHGSAGETGPAPTSSETSSETTGQGLDPVDCDLLPNDIAGLRLWLRADLDVSTDEAGVTDWLDQSAMGNDGFRHQADELGPSVVADGIGGRPALRFSQDSRLFFPNPGLTDFTIFEVGQSRSQGSGFHVILGPGLSSELNQQVRYEDESTLLLVGPGHGAPIRTYAIGDSRVGHSLTIDGEGGEWTVYRDGDLVDSLASGPGSWQIGCIGAWFGQHHLDGDVAELIIFERSLSDSERDSVQCYLDQRYGLPDG